MLLMIMCKVIAQHNTLVMARRIGDEDEDNIREKQLVNKVVGEMAWSGSEEAIDHSPRYVFGVLIMNVFDIHNRSNMPFFLLLLGQC